jgi:RHS repeat-associated protein
LQQIAGGVTTRYALDLNNDLAQVLSDGSNTYLYGLNRIAQQNIVGRQYYLGDALGSVRQLTNAVGSVTLARSYEPFGKLLSAAGNPLTKYGFTGEWTDPTGLIYLRARYHDPVTGRFLSKDPMRGLLALPQTINPYLYAINNPIKFTDPSGEFLPVWAITGGIGFVTGIGGYLLGQYISYRNLNCANLADALIAGGVSLLAGMLTPFATSWELIVLLGGVANIAQYSLTQFAHGNNITGSGALSSFLTGGIAGLIIRPFPSATKWDALWESSTKSQLINASKTTAAFAFGSLIRTLLGTTMTNINFADLQRRILR